MLGKSRAWVNSVYQAFPFTEGLPLNAFNIVFQSSSSKIGTLQEDVCNLLCGFLSNFLHPDLLAVKSNEEIHSFNYGNIANQLSNGELGISSITTLVIDSDLLRTLGGKRSVSLC